MKPVVYRIKGNVAHFVPAGCLHWPVGDKDLLRRWVKEVASLENGFTILLGDTQDCARTHYRDHQRSYRSDSNSQLALDEWVRKDVVELAKELAPLKGKIAGAILGNHYWEFQDGTNSEQYLCQLLGIPYLGPTGIVCVNLKHGHQSKEIVIYAHHNGGSKGGRTTGADVNTLERAEQLFDADVYVLSHTHRRFGYKLDRLGVGGRGAKREVRASTRVLVRSGAFLKGYQTDNPTTTQPHFPSYAEQQALRPTNLGWVTVRIDFKQTTHAGPRELDYRLSY
jgi:hypothetical protein